MTYGDKRDYRKIVIFVRHGKYFAYACVTTWAKTCKEARQKYYEAQYPRIALADIRCRFDAPSKRRITP